MKRSSRNSYNSGFTLPEILVSLFLVSIVFVALAGLLREAVVFYTDQSATLEVQKNCVLSLQRIGKVMRESNVESLDLSTPNSVVMASPRGLDGRVTYREGRLLWHKFVRFSVQNVGDRSVLLREDDRLDQPAFQPPSALYADFSTPSLEAIQAHDIESLTVTVSGRKAAVKIKANYKDIFEMSLQTDVKFQN